MMPSDPVMKWALLGIKVFFEGSFRFVVIGQGPAELEADLGPLPELAIHLHVRSRPEITPDAVVDVLDGDSQAGLGFLREHVGRDFLRHSRAVVVHA